MITSGGPEVIGWGDPRLNSIDPSTFSTFYSRGLIPDGLPQKIDALSPNQVEFAVGYGSAFSNAASKGSRLDVIVIVRDPKEFYLDAIGRSDLHFGTINSPWFHARWNEEKMNFYVGAFPLADGGVYPVKIGVIGHNEFLKHAKGGRPDVIERGEGKGHMYVAGRLQKANLVPILDNCSPEEKQEIDQAINQARIDGVLIGMGLSDEYFSLEQFGPLYTDLSYIADRRIEQAAKSKTLHDRNRRAYEEMFVPIFDNFARAGIVREYGMDIGGTYQKLATLDEQAVRAWLEECKKEAFRTNVLKNTWTMGLLTGIGYEIAKVQKKLAQKRGK